jgi:hypothetical protein
MLTKAGHGRSMPRGFVPQIFNSNRRLSLRLRDAPVGAAALGSIVSGVLTIRIAGSVGGQGTLATRALSIVILFFAPALRNVQGIWQL